MDNELQVDKARKIIHIDMDAFYASVEQLDRPELRALAIAVGGESSRGVVSAASYEARNFGVKSAMSGIIAKKLCPNLIFVKPRFERYKEISNKIQSIFREYTSLVEPLSLDEAFLDVSNYPSATILAKEIRAKIKKETGLNASAGISINKFLAKIASDWNKPNGQKTLPPEEINSFLDNLDIKKFHGIGKKTKEKMYQLGIFSGKDLKLYSKDFLISHFGKVGKYYYEIVRGVHNSPIRAFRIPKSIGSESTFEKNLSSEIYLEEKLKNISTLIEKRLSELKIAGKTVTLKIKYSDFNQQTRSKTGNLYLSSKELIFEQAKKLLYKDKLSESVRLVGITISNFNIAENNRKNEKVLEVSQLSLPF